MRNRSTALHMSFDSPGATARTKSRPESRNSAAAGPEGTVGELWRAEGERQRLAAGVVRERKLVSKTRAELKQADKKLEELRASVSMAGKGRRAAARRAKPDGAASKSQLRRQMQLLERRNVTAANKLSAQMRAIEDLREEINELRKDKMIFTTAFAQVQGKRQRQQQQIELNIELLQEYSTIRDNAQRRIEILHRQAADARQRFEDGVRDVERRLAEAEETIRQAEDKANQESSNRLLKQAEEEAGRAQSPKNGQEGSELSPEEAELLQQRKQARAAIQRWTKLRQETGVDTVDELLQEFEQDFEEYNRKLRRAQQLQGSIDSISEEIHSLEERLKEERERQVKPEHKGKAFTAMNERVTALKNQVFRASKEAERKNDLVHHLLDPLKTVIQRVGKPDQKEALLKYYSGGAAAQLVECMGVVEERANEIVCAAQMNEGSTPSSRRGGRPMQFTPGPSSPPGKTRANHEASRQQLASTDPVAELDAGGEELEVDRPMRHDELLAHVRGLVLRHRQGDVGGGGGGDGPPARRGSGIERESPRSLRGSAR